MDKLVDRPALSAGSVGRYEQSGTGATVCSRPGPVPAACQRPVTDSEKQRPAEVPAAANEGLLGGETLGRGPVNLA